MSESLIQKIVPTSKKERIVELDIIRGFALLGVLLVNIMWFNNVFINEVIGVGALAEPFAVNGLLNKASALFILLFAEMKFYTIFSILFGLGFYIFMDRAKAKHPSPKKLFLRRSLFLLLFGFLHFTFVWAGDILHVYGLVGLLLIFFIDKSPKTIIKWIIVLLVIATFTTAGLTILEDFGSMHSAQESVSAFEPLQTASIHMYNNGSYIDIIGFRLKNEAIFRVIGLVFQVPKILAMFLIGLYVGKKEIFKSLDQHKGQINKIWTLSGLIGAVFTGLLILLLSGNFQLHQALNSGVKIFFKEITSVSLCLFYITSIIKLYKSSKTAFIVAPLRYIGQMALTNYLMQCIICSLLFYSYGLGLYTQIGPALCLLLAFAIYAAQIICSKLWLQKFRFGPFELVWRSLTYGKLA